jgi:hypothetical protein
MIAEVETVVLPELDLKLRDDKGKPLDPIGEYELAEPDPEDLSSDVIASTYGDIWAEQFFRPWKEPPPPPPPPPIARNKQKDKGKANPSPPPPPPPGLAQTQVLGVFRIENGGEKDWGVYEVVTHNATANKREYLHVGDDLAGGKIILVHPHGVVVRKSSQDYVYPLGAMLNTSQVLSEAEYPEIWDAVMKLARR